MRGKRYVLELAIKGEVVLAFDGDGNSFLVVEGKGFRELYRHVVTVLLPERGEHRTALRAAVVEDVAEPYFEVAGIPDPS